MEYGEGVAVCAGDLLVSAAYASLGITANAEHCSELLRAVHRATRVTIDGQVQDLSLQNTSSADFSEYQHVAGRKSGPLLGLPLELALIASGHADHCAIAQRAAMELAVAYQIADDLADEDADAGGRRQPKCLNAVAVLRSSGCADPERVAKAEAEAALRRASDAAKTLPCGSGEQLLHCVRVIRDKLKVALDE
jgi:geranylgeranyl diphosphate synthase type II